MLAGGREDTAAHATASQHVTRGGHVRNINVVFCNDKPIFEVKTSGQTRQLVGAQAVVGGVVPGIVRFGRRDPIVQVNLGFGVKTFIPNRGVGNHGE